MVCVVGISILLIRVSNLSPVKVDNKGFVTKNFVKIATVIIGLGSTKGAVTSEEKLQIYPYEPLLQFKQIPVVLLQLGF